MTYSEMHYCGLHSKGWRMSYPDRCTPLPAPPRNEGQK